MECTEKTVSLEADPLHNLTQVTKDEAQKLLSSLQDKSSPRDFISTILLKECSRAFCWVQNAFCILLDWITKVSRKVRFHRDLKLLRSHL